MFIKINFVLCSWGRKNVLWNLAIVTFGEFFSLSEIALKIILASLYLRKKFTYDIYKFILIGRQRTLILGDVSSAVPMKTLGQSPAYFCHPFGLCALKVHFLKVAPLLPSSLYTIHLLDHFCLRSTSYI